MRNLLNFLLMLLGMLLISGCTPTAVETQVNLIPSLPSKENTQIPTITANITKSTLAQKMGLTYQDPTGNRYIQGQIDLRSTTPIDIPLAGTPVWIVGIGQSETLSTWIAVLEDGTVQAFQIREEEVTPLDSFPASLPAGTPPVLIQEPDLIYLGNTNAEDGSTISHPILTPEGYFDYITPDGDLVVEREGGKTVLQINAMTDSRILSDGQGHLLLLTDPTNYYDHAVLGNAIEAHSVTLVALSPSISAEKIITLPSDKVIEGIAPIWADLDQDGSLEIIVTESSFEGGAQLVVYSMEGEKLAASRPIGSGYRWRHQIAVASFGPAGEIELVDVHTPHLGGVVEFFQLDGDKLVKVAQVSGYTSHVIGSRNLDMAFAGDVDGDGYIEVLLPNQNRTVLGIIQRTAEGAEVDWEIPLEDVLMTNLASVVFSDGKIAIAAGLKSGILRIWLP